MSTDDCRQYSKLAQPLDIESVTQFRRQVAGHDFDFKHPTVGVHENISYN